MVGGSSGETKIAEAIRDGKNRRSVLYIAFAGKSGEGGQPPGSAAHVGLAFLLYFLKLSDGIGLYMPSGLRY